MSLMAFQRFCLLFAFSLLLCSLSRAESTGSVFFIDSSSHQFFRESSSDHVVKLDSISDTEVAAAVSVLLGFAPPLTLSSASSSKLNQILVPNPFQRPRAVFMLEVTGVDDSNVMAKDNTIFSSAVTRNIVFGSKKVEIQLPAEDEVSVLPFDEMSEFTDKEIANFASWIGGTYASETEEPLNGELIIPLANDATVKFHMSKRAEREFVSSILYLFHNFRRGIQMHEDLSHGPRSQAELLSGTFDGIKILQKQYGPEGISQHGKEVLLAMLSKIHTELQQAYEGQIVGVVISYGEASPEPVKFSVAFSPLQRSARWLEESEAASSIDEARRVALVRRTLAWITGIILLLSTLLGIHFLLNMPLTKDTLLYSNVKLD